MEQGDGPSFEGQRPQALGQGLEPQLVSLDVEGGCSCEKERFDWDYYRPQNFHISFQDLTLR